MTAVEQIIYSFNEELKVAIAIGNEDKIRTIKHLSNIATLYLIIEKEQIIKHSVELCKILISNPFETSGKTSQELVDAYFLLNFKSE